jgi:hypothetical protein
MPGGSDQHPFSLRVRGQDSREERGGDTPIGLNYDACRDRVPCHRHPILITEDAGH